MKLSHEQIKSITLGAAYVEEVEQRTVFHRFTKEQEELYSGVKQEFYNKAFSNSCIRLEFETDSASLFLKTYLTKRSARLYHSHDIFVDGRLAGRLWGKFDDTPESVKNGIAAGMFSLGESGKTKKVCIHLPWSYSSDIIELSLDDGASLVPIKKARKILFYGDSITQGYNAVYTSNSYASKVAVGLDAEARNKGIGAEVFRPALAELRDEDFEPDIVTVAYGTNDWAGGVSKELFEERSDKFFGTLSKNYPDAKIFAIAPIWRADWQNMHSLGEFFHIREHFASIAEKYPNVTLIDGFDFLPHDPDLYNDRFLHPNDNGFAYYADGLLDALKKYL